MQSLNRNCQWRAGRGGILPIVLLTVALGCGCATCRTNGERQSAEATSKIPFWQACFSWLFDCVTYNAMEYGTYQQRFQSGDPTR